MQSREVAVLVLTLFLSGCSLLQKVNRQFATVDEKQQRQTAVDSTAKALTSLSSPTIAVGVDLSDAGHLLLNEELSKLGVTKLSLVGEQQLLKISVEFHHQFVASDAGTNAAWQRAISRWRPEVAGSLVLFAGLKNPDIQAINQTAVPAMELQVLPVFSSLHVTDLKVLGHLQTDALVEPLVAMLNLLKDNVTGVLSRSKFTTISLPEVAMTPIDLSHSFSFTAAAQKITTTVSAHPMQIPLQLDTVAWRIAGDRLTILIQVLPTSATDIPLIPVTLSSFEAIDHRFDALLASEFGISKPAGSAWVAVSKALIATSVENAVEQVAPCAAFSVPDISSPPVQKMISIPANQADCRQDPTHCDIHCVKNSDTRSCGGNFFAKKACQISKDAVNGRMAAEYAACQAGAAAKKAVCTTTQAAQQAGCEGFKTTFNALLQGEVGNVTAQASGTAQAQVCLPHLKLAQDFSHVEIDLTASGKANATLSLGFSPRRVVGRAVCALPTKVKNNLAVDLSAPQWRISSPITLKQDGDATEVAYTIQGTDVAISYSPSLPSLLLQDLPTIDLNCPIVGAALTTVDIAGFVKGIPNQFPLSVPTLSGFQKIPLPTVSIGTEKLGLTLQPTSDKALILGGTLASP